MNYNPLHPSLQVGDIVYYAYDGENFGSGCAYSNRIVEIIYPKDGFGVYSYKIVSGLPKSFPVIAHPSQVRKKDCDHCPGCQECKYFLSKQDGNKFYKVVDNLRQRYIDYKDGQPIHVAYQFLDEKAYTNSKQWLNDHSIDFIDLKFVEAPIVNDTITAHIIVTTHSRSQSRFVFNHIEDCEPNRICVIVSRMVDFI